MNNTPTPNPSPQGGGGRQCRPTSPPGGEEPVGWPCAFAQSCFNASASLRIARVFTVKHTFHFLEMRELSVLVDIPFARHGFRQLVAHDVQRLAG